MTAELWGLWHGDDERGGFMRDSKGNLRAYPDEQLARTEAWSMARRAKVAVRARSFREFNESQAAPRPTLQESADAGVRQ